MTLSLTKTEQAMRLSAEYFSPFGGVRAAGSEPCGAEGAEGTIVHVIPPPETRIPLARLDQSPVLLRLGYDQARTWLEGSVTAGQSS